MVVVCEQWPAGQPADGRPVMDTGLLTTWAATHLHMHAGALRGASGAGMGLELECGGGV